MNADPENGMEVIDADGHVVEPPAVWNEYLDPAFRDRVDPGDGIQSLAMARAYGPASGVEPSEWRWSQAGFETWDPTVLAKLSIPGGSDPAARLVDMDIEGIDAAVLYPTTLLSWLEEPDLFGAVCRAYNDWLRDYCAHAPARLFGVAVVPVQDQQAAIAEMHRCVDELGFKAIMIRPGRYIGNKPLHHPDYDPLWAAAAHIGCPVAIHPSPHGDIPNAARLLGLDAGHLGPAMGLALRQGLTNAIDLQLAVGGFVLGGVCQRHPDLQVAFLEGTGGWIVPMLERFDHQFKVFGSPDQKTLPSELFTRQCLSSFDPDEAALGFTATTIGAELILWASDYPHPDALIPGVVKELREAVEGLDAKSQRLIVGANARRFYRL